MKSLGFRRSMILLAMGGSTLFFSLGTFNPNSFGCNYAENSDYQTWFQGVGNSFIQTVSDNYFSFGTDWDALVRNPATNLAQAAWGNWLDTRIPDDLPTNAVVLR